jgi:hypothetical protein
MDEERSHSIDSRSPRSGSDDDASAESGVGVWALLWTILIAKLATILLVVWAAHSFEAGALIGATMLPWLAAAIFVGASPILFRYRLRRVRAKRDQLRRSEWMLPAETDRADRPTQPSLRRPGP